MSELNLTGCLITSSDKTVKSLVTYLPAIELENYFYINRIPSQLEVFFDAAKNKTNLKRVSDIQADLEKELSQEMIGAPISLTVVLDGKPTLSLTGDAAKITYDRDSSFIVGEVLILTAVLKSLGIKTPLFSSRLSASEIKKKSAFRQMLAVQSVVLTVIFDDESGIDEEQVKELFFKFNRQHSGMHLSQFSQANNAFPMKPYVLSLADSLNLERFGGVSDKSKHVKMSESYLTTEYILFKLLVGAVAGAHVQEICKMSDDVMTPLGKKVSECLSNGNLEYIKAFLSSWLTPLEKAGKAERAGFRLSAQIWQALALVIYQLVSDGASVQDVSHAGFVLGQLDYSKKATHWSNCEVMALDSNGRLYKNAANSTREFRNGLAIYFYNYVQGESSRLTF
ncbi:hypothetical protein PDPUS_1_00448 [Photobacterium damselae subsp. piscicida]|uniref:Uncharacterized protein n=1 Tax=Photobacterium damsela subsp. piscicida TaxID=38294 RepID=A0A1V1V857_PHODP|nr:hypothetical protein [Photobacterium damselae]MBE8130187.1 hypothetical protein [Photobacterium damselae subsp. piscicida]PSV71843.1 hypothetical protein CTT35_10285 [Photobacterium damselae]PSW77360.1 hypothetical protein CTT37_10870 [Photobacterium damselae]QOD52362.1 hypothetical protein IC628_13410 [Photobacterium damselae subsp. piscicida]QOD56211.1 hypothetical protein IC627_13450 [Photobacterium damselae subsp. piscicida]